jgi:hypothetical protein
MRTSRSRVATMLAVATLLAACSGPAASTIPGPIDTLAPASPSTGPATTGAGASDAFAVAGLVANISPDSGPPDPSTFETAFTTNNPFNGDVLKRIGIYVTYRLRPGLEGKVSVVTTSPDGMTITDSYDYPASADSAYFAISYANGFALGEHRTVLTFGPTGDSISLPFTITEPAPAPAATAAPTTDSTGFRNLGLNEFVPDLNYEFPISFDIPGDYAHFSIEGRSGRYIWMRPVEGQGSTFPTEFTKPDTAYFVVGPSLNVGYDADTDKFIGVAESAVELQALVEDQGIQVRRYERQDLPDFAVLILESVSPYGEGNQTRTVVTMYLATGIETNTFLIQFYFATGPEAPADRAIWERFESSLGQSG